MFKTVFSRLLVIYLIVILSALIAFGIGSAEMFRLQFRNERLDALAREAEQINEIIETKFEKNRIAARDELAVIARQYNAAIWIIDRDYALMQVTDKAHEGEWEGTQVLDISENIIQMDILQNVLRGYNTYSDGFFGNLFDEPVQTLGRPLILDKRVQGAIFIHVKLSDISAQVAQIYRNVAIASLFAVVFASFLIYFTAVRFSRSLAEMNVVAQRFSKGDFSVRPKIKGRDEIAQLGASIDKMADDLNELEHMRRSFVANVSHELKSPLAAMRGFLEGMLDGTVAESERPATIGVVLDETKRLNLLINDLLDLARIESGKFPIAPSVFDINELMRRTLILFESRIDAKRLDVFVRFRQEYCYVYADKDRIEQVLRNLLDNAIKFSLEGGRLSLITHASLQRRCAVISIADSGIGISQEDLRHVWDRFYKADKAHTPSQTGESGTGLGLSILKRIIDEHNQQIRVKSPGENLGSTFTFTLALAKEKDLPSSKSKPNSGILKGRAT